MRKMRLESVLNSNVSLGCSHHIGISYYVNFLGHLGSNGFQQKGRFGTQGNLKNQDPRDPFGATKGQLISKCPYEKSVWTKYQRKYF